MKRLIVVLLVCQVGMAQAGVKEKLRGVGLGFIKVLRNRVVCEAMFYSGLAAYSYFNACSDAYIYDYMYGDGITYGRATRGHWHANKNLANVGMVMAGYSLWEMVRSHKLTWTRAAVKFGTGMCGANALWHRTYYYGRYGNQFPEDDGCVYKNAIVIPCPGGDIVKGLTRDQAKMFDLAEWSVFGAGIAMLSVWGK